MPEYEGSILCGSHAVGTANTASDIDIHILLSDSIGWRERGNKMVDGYLIEYFANPLRQFEDQLKRDLGRGKRTLARMLATGRIVHDERGEAEKLKRWAKGQMSHALPKLDGGSMETAKYALWDSIDGLSGEEPSSPAFSYLYPQVVDEALRKYALFHGLEAPAASKAYRFFAEASFPEKYGMEKFPDPLFGKLFVQCLEADKEGQITAARNLADFVENSVGGFNIDGWKVQTPAIEIRS